MKLDFRKDIYHSTRGGYARFLDIICGQCKNTVMIYQKDGPGILKRIYLDRICYPEDLKNLQSIHLKDIDNLICPSCGEILGVPYVYQKEERKAFRLFVDAVLKRIRASQKEEKNK